MYNCKYIPQTEGRGRYISRHGHYITRHTADKGRTKKMRENEREAMEAMSGEILERAAEIFGCDGAPEYARLADVEDFVAAAYAECPELADMESETDMVQGAIMSGDVAKRARRGRGRSERERTQDYMVLAASVEHITRR